MKRDNKIKDINEYNKLKKNRNKKRKVVKILCKIIIPICIVSIIIVNICGYVTLSRLKYEINSLKEELKRENIALEQIKAVVDSNKSTLSIENEAREMLNMDYPKEHQIRYINVGD